jgi:hypothetical protein
VRGGRTTWCRGYIRLLCAANLFHAQVRLARHHRVLGSSWAPLGVHRYVLGSTRALRQKPEGSTDILQQANKRRRDRPTSYYVATDTSITGRRDDVILIFPVFTYFPSPYVTEPGVLVAIGWHHRHSRGQGGRTGGEYSEVHLRGNVGEVETWNLFLWPQYSQ